MLLAQLKPQPPLRFAALASTTGGGCSCRRLRHAASAGSATGWGQDRQMKIHISRMPSTGTDATKAQASIDVCRTTETQGAEQTAAIARCWH